MDARVTVVRTARIRTVGDPPETGKAGIEDLIRERLWTAVVDRSLPPGTHLKEEQLQAVFGASRARIRRVLLQLHCEGLIDLVPNIGAFVARPSIKEAREIFAARRLIEAELIRNLVPRLTDAARNALELLVRKEREAHERGAASEEIFLSGLFHIRLGEYADSPVLLGFLKELIPRTSLIIALYQARTVNGCGTSDHRHLIEAIAERNDERAVALMNRHLSHIESHLNLRPAQKSTIDLGEILRGGGDRRARTAP